MLRHHMAVITNDNRLKREVQRVTAATGSTADFAADPTGLGTEKPHDLAILDARGKEPDKAFFARVPERSSVMYLLEEETLLDRLALFKDARVTSLMCHDARFDDDEFIASATKALHGSVFGLQKYFPWGVTTFTMVVKNYEEKNRAIDILLRYAQLAGVRGPVRDRIQMVADELMMNALYHAPTDDEGRERFRDRPLKELAQLPEVPPIQVQYGSSGRYFGIAVRDGGGSLTRPKALDYLMRARTGVAHIENKATGAGLGLISVLRSVSKLIFNLDPGYSTEVIGLFDIELFSKGKVGARSVHIFTSRMPPTPEADDDDEDEEAAKAEAAKAAAAAGDTMVVPRQGAPRRGPWIAAAILLAAVTALGTALVMKRMADPKTAAAATTAATLEIVAEPAAATITVDGKAVRPGVPMPAPRGASVVQVAHPGHVTWTKNYAAGALTGAVKLHVGLKPQTQPERKPDR
jgi:hypothetical protein